MRVELLYIEGCPNVAPTLTRLRHAFDRCGIRCSVIEVAVADADHARAVQFLGSPTVRMNSLDIEPSARSRADYGLACRTYEDGTGVPSEALMRAGIEEAQRIAPQMDQ